jgi:hypothetical protein
MPDLIPYFAILVPIVALCIPIVAIWTHHKKEMAKIAAATGGSAVNSNEIAALRTEVSELKELVHSQILAMDSIHRLGMGSSRGSEYDSTSLSRESRL